MGSQVVAAKPVCSSTSASGSGERLPVCRAWGWLLVVLALGFGLRSAALWLNRDATLVLDERTYLLWAEALLDGKGYLGSYQSWVRHPGSAFLDDLPQYRGAFQAPLYPSFMALVMAVAGRSVLAVKFAQVLLGTGTILLVYSIGRSWLGHTRGLMAAMICAVYPNLIAFSHYLFTETLFVFLLASLVLLLTRERFYSSKAVALLGGIVLGLAVLTRGSVVYFLPLLVFWLLATNRRRLRQAVISTTLMLFACALTIAPWTIRNHRVHGGFVLIDTNGPFNLWRGNTPESYADRPDSYRCYDWPFDNIPIQPVGKQWVRKLVAESATTLGVENTTDLQIIQCARTLAWECIREDPAAFLRRAKYKFIDMWNPTSFLLRHFQFGLYGTVSPPVQLACSGTAVLGYLLVMGFGLWGWVCRRREAWAWLILILVFYFTAIHLVAFGLTRFRLPLMPFIIILAADRLCALLAALWAPEEPGEATSQPTQAVTNS